MSFRLQGPSLLLNSYAFTDIFGGCGMFMDITWNCSKTTAAKDVVNWIGIACSQSPGKRLAPVKSTPARSAPLKSADQPPFIMLRPSRIAATGPPACAGA